MLSFEIIAIFGNLYLEVPIFQNIGHMHGVSYNQIRHSYLFYSLKMAKVCLNKL